MTVAHVQNGHTRRRVQGHDDKQRLYRRYLNTTKSCSGTAEACFEYIREGSGDNRSDLQTVVRNICKGSLQSQKWIAQQIRRAQTDGMSGSRREVTHCRVPIPPNGLFVFDGINMLDKNVHPKRRMMHALQAFGAKTFEQFDANVADIKAKLDRQKDIAERRATPWPLSFVCNMHSGKPKKQTVRDSNGCGGCRIQYGAADSHFAAPASRLHYDWKPARLNAKHRATGCSIQPLRVECACQGQLCVLRKCDVVREEFRNERARKAKQVEEAAQGLDSIEADEFISPSRSREDQVKRCKEKEPDAMRLSGPQRRAVPSGPRAGLARRAFRAVERDQQHRHPSRRRRHRRGSQHTRQAGRPSLPPRQGRLRGALEEGAAEPESAQFAARKRPIQRSARAQDPGRLRGGRRRRKERHVGEARAVLNDVLHNTEVRFEGQRVCRRVRWSHAQRPAWEPCSVIP